MSYDERLKRLVGNNDPFWHTIIDKFIEANYENKEKGMDDIENLYKDKVRFNEFTKLLVQKRNNLKEVKEEFFANNEEKNTNIEKITDKIVEDIKNLEDDTTISISKLLEENEIDKPTMFQIYDMTINKLKEFGLYLNFGDYENQRAGLPFNIPFRKGYITNIKISERIYNGHYSKGSIFTDVVELNLSGGNANVKKSISFCIDEKIKDKATLNCSIPFNMTDEEITNLNNILNEIKNKYQPHDKNGVKLPMPEYLKYVDLSINGVNYAIDKDDTLYLKLRESIKNTFFNESFYKTYDALVNQKVENLNNYIVKEKCTCGNTLNIFWETEQKFQMVRCPNCNNEMKFKNPNLK